MEFLYVFLIVFAVATIALSIYARKKIAAIENEKERKAVKAQWQLIFGLLGVAMIVVVGILIFTMF